MAGVSTGVDSLSATGAGVVGVLSVCAGVVATGAGAAGVSTGVAVAGCAGATGCATGVGVASILPSPVKRAGTQLPFSS